MTNTELTANVTALEAHSLTSLLDRIADGGHDGIQIARADVAILREAGLVKYARGYAMLTGAGWSVATRVAAIRCAATMSQPGHWQRAA